MADERRLIYLDHALQAVSENYRSDMPKYELDMLVATRKRLKSISTVDAAPVVRCKDCKHYKPQNQGAHRNCTTPYCMRVVAVKVSPDAFCSYGESRGEAAHE